MKVFSKWEYGVAVFLWGLYAWVGPGEDFVGYRLWVLDPSRYTQNVGIFSPAWLAPLLAPLAVMPGRAGYILYLALLLVLLLYSVQMLGGSKWVALLSAQTFWMLWWGQIDLLAIFGIVLGWQALEKEDWKLLALAMILATVKPQTGVIPIALIWWWSGSMRWKALGVCAVVGLVSLVVWGPWPLWVIQSLRTFVAARSFGPWNISIGPWALPLFIPALLLPMPRFDRLRVVIATTLLISPYMPYYSTLILLCFPLPVWLYLFAFIGYLPSVIGTQLAWNAIILLPIGVLLWTYVPLFIHWRKSKAIQYSFR
ncbi:MAG TPA: hypothetical protein PK530_11850 [Anaerolineales bacterium]|nr:hypothetical protein [Anaerolineales bacterium]